MRTGLYLAGVIDSHKTELVGTLTTSLTTSAYVSTPISDFRTPFSPTGYFRFCDVYSESTTPLLIRSFIR